MNHPLGGESSGSAEPQSDPSIESQCGGTRETEIADRVPMRRNSEGDARPPASPDAAWTRRKVSGSRCGGDSPAEVSPSGGPCGRARPSPPKNKAVKDELHRRQAQDSELPGGEPSRQARGSVPRELACLRRFCSNGLGPARVRLERVAKQREISGHQLIQ